MSKPVAYRFKSPLSEEGQWEYGKEPPVGSRWAIEPLYTIPPQRKPLTEAACRGGHGPWREGVDEMTQPEALSEQEAAHIYRLREEIMQQEIEMHRLRQQIERMSWDGIHTCHAECQRPVCKLTRERNALLEALKKLEYSSDGAIKRFPEESEVNAAIKAVEEGK